MMSGTQFPQQHEIYKIHKLPEKYFSKPTFPFGYISMDKPRVTVITGQEDDSREIPSMICRSLLPLTAGGIRQSMFTLISAAIGGGILCLPYVMSLAGVINGIILLILASLLAFISMRMLMLCVARTGISSYSKLLAQATNFKYAGPFLDIVTILFGQGVVIALFVFLGDFVPPVIDSLGFDVPTDRSLCIIVCCLGAIPFAFPSKLSALQNITPISTISLIVTALVVAYRTSSMHLVIPPESADLDLCIFSTQLLKCFSIVVSAFICHTNVVSVATELVDPSYKRSTKITFRAVCIQLVFYLLIAVCGYISFGKSVEQNFIKNYSYSDKLITLCRILLALTIFFGLPLNTNPTAKALVNILFEKDGLLIEVEDPMRKLRITIGVAVLIIGAIVSLFVPGIADVVGILGGSFGTLIMLVFPAIIYASVFRYDMHKTEEIVMVGILLIAAGVCFTSVVITVIDF